MDLVTLIVIVTNDSLSRPSYSLRENVDYRIAVADSGLNMSVLTRSQKRPKHRLTFALIFSRQITYILKRTVRSPDLMQSNGYLII